MRFVKHHLESIAGVEIYPILALLLFFFFFVAVVWFVIRADKKEMNELKNIPFHSQSDSHSH